MPKASVSASGPGASVLIPAQPGRRIIVTSMALTFSQSATSAQKVAFLSDSDVIAGPFYVVNGQPLEYMRRMSDPERIALGASFGIDLEDTLKVAGTIEYDIGAQ